MQRFMKKFRKQFRYGEKGFTLIELLIVVAILGILAVVVVPNLAAFLGTGQVAAANTEVANVETAALAFYADNNAFPDSVSDLSSYLSGNTTYDGYGFDDDYGRVIVSDATPWPGGSGVAWNEAAHKWEK